MSSKIKVEELSQFVNTHPKGNIFQTQEIFKVYEKTRGYEPTYLSARDENHMLKASLISISGMEALLGSDQRGRVWGRRGAM